jgi:hypothetical protein
MKKIFALCLLLAFCSCTLQKRHYRPGVYFSFHSAHPASLPTAQKAPASPLKAAQLKTPVFTSVSATGRSNQGPAEMGKLSPARKKSFSVQVRKNIFRAMPSAHTQNKKSIFRPIEPNHVPKAALKLLVVSLIFLGGALYVLSNFHELVYITVILLILAVLFALVSFFTSIGARKDKINNSSGWRVSALLTLIFSLLIIGAATLLLISLF